MKRRDFLALAAGVAAAWPLAAPVRAQQTLIKRVGVLASDTMAFFGPLREDLKAMGWVEGRNIAYEIREAKQNADVLKSMASDLVGLKPDVIVAGATPAASAAKMATLQVPVVAAAGDLLATGLVSNLAHPNGNLTGVSLQSVEAQGKMMSVIHDLLPNARRIAVLANDADPFTQPFVAQTEAAAESLGIAIQVVMYHGGDPLGPAFAKMSGADGVIIQFSIVTQESIDTAIRAGLAPFSNAPVTFAASGALMTITFNAEDVAMRLAADVNSVLMGTKPGDIPVQQPGAFDIALNLSTAHTLAVTVPPAVLFQATQLFGK